MIRQGTTVQGKEERKTKCEFCGDDIDDVPININYFTIHIKCWRHVENVVNEYNKQAILKERF